MKDSTVFIITVISGGIFFIIYGLFLNSNYGNHMVVGGMVCALAGFIMALIQTICEVISDGKN